MPDSSCKRILSDKEMLRVEQIFVKYSKDIYYYVYSLTHNDFLSQDIVDNTFLKWIDAKPNIEDEEEIFRYLLRIARNLAFDKYHDDKHYYFFNDEEDYEKTMESIPDPDSGQSERNIQVSVVMELMHKLLGLTESYIVYSHAALGYEFTKLAEMTGLTIRQVRYTYFKSLEIVRNAYEKGIDKCDIKKFDRAEKQKEI